MAEISEKEDQNLLASATSKLSAVKESGASLLTTHVTGDAGETTKKRLGLKIPSDRAKLIGGLTPCSSPSEGQMFSSASGPDWKSIENEVSHAIQTTEKPN